MDNDLISRQALMKEFSDFVRRSNNSDFAPTPTWNDAVSLVESLPSAERHGRWIPVDSYSAFGGDEATWMAHGNPVAFYYCSECKEQAYAGEDGESLITDYCPNCGAKMEVE